jgi:hypothetical protein
MGEPEVIKRVTLRQIVAASGESQDALKSVLREFGVKNRICSGHCSQSIAKFGCGLPYLGFLPTWS